MPEKRRHFRKSATFAVEFSVAHPGQGARETGVCRDFSLGGMNIRTTKPAPFGANVTVYMPLKGTQGLGSVPGIVRWIKAGEMGVQFGLLGARETYALTEMLAEP